MILYLWYENSAGQSKGAGPEATTSQQNRIVMSYGAGQENGQQLGVMVSVGFSVVPRMPYLPTASRSANRAFEVQQKTQRPPLWEYKHVNMEPLLPGSYLEYKGVTGEMVGGRVSQYQSENDINVRLRSGGGSLTQDKAKDDKTIQARRFREGKKGNTTRQTRPA